MLEKQLADLLPVGLIISTEKEILIYNELAKTLFPWVEQSDAIVQLKSRLVGSQGEYFLEPFHFTYTITKQEGKTVYILEKIKKNTNNNPLLIKEMKRLTEELEKYNNNKSNAENKAQEEEYILKIVAQAELILRNQEMLQEEQFPKEDEMIYLGKLLEKIQEEFVEIQEDIGVLLHWKIGKTIAIQVGQSTMFQFVLGILSDLVQLIKDKEIKRINISLQQQMDNIQLEYVVGNMKGILLEDLELYAVDMAKTITRSLGGSYTILIDQNYDFLLQFRFSLPPCTMVASSLMKEQAMVELPLNSEAVRKALLMECSPILPSKYYINQNMSTD